MINIYEAAHDQLAQRHYREIVDQIGRSRGRKVPVFDQWFQSFDPTYNLEVVITAKPDKLAEIRSKIGKAPFPSFVNYFLTMYTYFSKGTNSFIGNRDYNAMKLMEDLGIRVCPLCNRNHIGNVERPGKGKKRTSQLDHFHNKSHYPYLAMSFFNLIPSCPSCNHTKGIADIDLSPYASIDLDPLIRVGFNIQDVDYLFDERRLHVSLTEDPSIRNNVRRLGLESLYKTHNDVAFEMLERFRMYSKLMRKEVLDTFPGLFRGEEEIRNTLFGSYLQKENLKKQVLAKLKKDIFELLVRYEQQRTGTV